MAENLKYGGLLQAIEALHRETAGRAVAAINRWLVLRNWLIGAYLVEFEQNGEERAVYGQGLLRRLSIDLRKRGIKGASPDMLERMRLFSQRYPQIRERLSAPAVRNLMKSSSFGENLPISAPMVRKSSPEAPTPLQSGLVLRLAWTHLADLARIEDPWKRAFYENECLNGNWSKRQLQRQIGSMLYERTGLSTDKKKVIAEGRGPERQGTTSIADLIRDPYVLEFVGLAEKPAYRESDLETALLDHLQSFLLELGAGFCFEARQKRITTGTEHDYIDLVFYHRHLRCHLLIDLKVRAFRHGDAGQMNYYLNYWKANEMGKGDSLPVGLLLCSDKDATRVEYASAGLDHQLFVSRYLVALPKPEELQEMIEADRESLEAGGMAEREWLEGNKE